MARRVPENLTKQGIAKASTSMSLPEEPQCSMRKWYFTRQEIEDHSPSRRDGISLKKESHLRKAYCSFLQEVGMKLKVPQLTIACALMLCHRFYMRQSHAKNDWQRIATASIFLACKVEETPRFLNDVVVVAYEMVHKLDSSALQSIRQRDVFNKQKELVIVDEILLLSTIGFDLDIQLPYKILVTALKRLNIFPDLAKVAWNFVNDWLHTSLCLQYKPHYIAAGSVSLAAGIQKVKLPTEKGHVWWLEFDVSPKQLDEVIQGMRSMLKPDRKQAPPPKNGRLIQSETLSRKPSVSSSQSCVTSELTVDPNSRQGALGEDRGLGESVMSNIQNRVEGGNSVTMKEALPCQTSDSGSASGIVEYAGAQIKPIRGELDDQNSRCKIVYEHNNCSTVMSNSQNLVKGNNSVTMKEALPCQTSDSGSVSGIVEDAGAGIKPLSGELDDQNTRCKIVSVHNNSSKIDINRIRDALKRRRGDKVSSMKSVDAMDDEIDAEAWIQSELENGVELDDTSAKKKQRKAA